LEGRIKVMEEGKGVDEGEKGVEGSGEGGEESVGVAL